VEIIWFSINYFLSMRFFYYHLTLKKSNFLSKPDVWFGEVFFCSFFFVLFWFLVFLVWKHYKCSGKMAPRFQKFHYLLIKRILAVSWKNNDFCDFPSKKKRRSRNKNLWIINQKWKIVLKDRKRGYEKKSLIVLRVL
jgi:hypothetical protein